MKKQEGNSDSMNGCLEFDLKDLPPSIPSIFPTSANMTQEEYPSYHQASIGSRIQRSLSAPPISQPVDSNRFAHVYTSNDLANECYYYYNPVANNLYDKVWEGNKSFQVSKPILKAPFTQQHIQAEKLTANDNEMSTIHKYAQSKVTLCESPTGSSENSPKIAAVHSGKSLIDRIQEDFPRTPSPVLNGVTLMSTSSVISNQNEVDNQEITKKCNIDATELATKLREISFNEEKKNNAASGSELFSSDENLVKKYISTPPGLSNNQLNSFDMFQSNSALDQNGGDNNIVFRSQTPSPPPFTSNSLQHNAQYEPSSQFKSTNESRLEHRIRSNSNNDQEKSFNLNSQIRFDNTESNQNVSNQLMPIDRSISINQIGHDGSFFGNGLLEYQHAPSVYPPPTASRLDYRRHSITNAMPYENALFEPATRTNIKVAPYTSSLMQNIASHSSASNNLNHNMASSYALPRSMLLEDFRNSVKSKKWELIDARGHLVEFAKDQHGSRFIQQRLETAKNDIKDIVFHEIYPVSLSLMTDVFGNYVIQKFLEHGTELHVKKLMHVIYGRVLDLAMQMYGCRVIQKALEVISPRHQLQVIAELKGHVLTCVKDQNGNHVIQKCIEIIPWRSPPKQKYGPKLWYVSSSFEASNLRMSDDITYKYEPSNQNEINEVNSASSYHNESSNNQKEASYQTTSTELSAFAIIAQSEFIVQAFVHNVYTLSTHPYGCRVIQRVLEYCNEAQMVPILKEIHEHSFPLIEDQYGNYVIQHVLEHGHIVERSLMINRIYPHIMKLSQHKYASNVIEKCLIYASVDQLRRIVQNVLELNKNGECAFHYMMKDQYANYVVQKLIDVANHQERQLMVRIIQSHASHLKRYTFGKHILTRLEKLTGSKLV